MSPGESIYSPRSGMRTNSGDKKRQKCSWTKVRPEQQKIFNYKNILQKLTDMTDCQEKRSKAWSKFSPLHDNHQSRSRTTKRNRTDDGINVTDMQNIFYVQGNILQ